MSEKMVGDDWMQRPGPISIAASAQCVVVFTAGMIAVLGPWWIALIATWGAVTLTHVSFVWAWRRGQRTASTDPGATK